jgi:hypothetical protein
MTNERGERILRQRGFNCEYEPDWILEGKKPDFFCSGSIDIWVEVKTLGPAPENELLGNAHVELRRRAAKIPYGGNATAWCSEGLNSREAKFVMKLAQRELRKLHQSTEHRRIVAMVPDDPIYDRSVRFAMQTEHGLIEITSYRSLSGKYDHPFDLEPNPDDQKTILRSSDDTDKEVYVSNLITYNDGFRVALDITPEPGDNLRLIATFPTGVAKELKNRTRIRNAVKEANAQFKNGCKYREAPCLLMIFHDALDVGEEIELRSALYGDLTYSAPSSDQWDKGELALTRNGAWTENQHRTTSAASYIRNESVPVTVHNRWAYFPLPLSLLGGKDVVAKDDGNFNEI